MRLPFHILRFTILQGFFFLSLDGMTPRSGLKEFGYDRRMSVSPRSRGGRDGGGRDASDPCCRGACSRHASHNGRQIIKTDKKRGVLEILPAGQVFPFLLRIRTSMNTGGSGGVRMRAQFLATSDSQRAQQTSPPRLDCRRRPSSEVCPRTRAARLRLSASLDGPPDRQTGKHYLLGSRKTSGPPMALKKKSQRHVGFPRDAPKGCGDARARRQ